MEWFMDQLDIVLVVVCANMFLSSLGAILDKIKDKTSSDLDNKASDFLNKWLPKLKTVVDWLSGNRQH